MSKQKQEIQSAFALGKQEAKNAVAVFGKRAYVQLFLDMKPYKGRPVSTINAINNSYKRGVHESVRMFALSNVTNAVAVFRALKSSDAFRSDLKLSESQGKALQVEIAKKFPDEIGKLSFELADHISDKNRF